MVRLKRLLPEISQWPFLEDSLELAAYKSSMLLPSLTEFTEGRLLLKPPELSPEETYYSCADS